ncbi:MAG: Activator of (R)-2-hydroxyglutaryl-CoA dehydratase [Bryobacterales bacterium]|nr:Activator of (R)-2-hydroxyglutaryl-CoA dehydratase [Bryobacterales bacterium]
MQDRLNNVLVAEPEEDIARRLEVERARLRREAGLVQLQHFLKPKENPFTAEERDHVTILFGGLTWKHEALICSVFHGNGYKCEILPCPDVPAFQLGKEYGNNGQCNPTYFTVGHLVQHLQKLEAQGMPRQEIINNYVFFTAGSCGPCRFGMYEAEYRFALQNAGFDGFRVLLFQQQEGIKAASGEPGLKFTVDFGVGMLNALNLGDVMNDLLFQIRPFEVSRGETDRIFKECMDRLSTTLRDREPFEILQAAPSWAKDYLSRPEKKKLKNTLNTLGKIRENLYGKVYLDAMHECRDQMNKIEIDRTRVKPIVKITGEFWAQTTEGDGNFHMFDFLEREGAQVLVEPIATWVAYLLNQAKAISQKKKDVEMHHNRFQSWEVSKIMAREKRYGGKWLMLSMGEAMWAHFYHRVIDHLGGITHRLVDQKELARLAEPFYNRFARGGEGHLEVGKNVYYTVHHLAHMVLALKPFGCMPSSQSDGVQSAVINKFRDMIFLPIETSGEGEVNAHSRVQMALGEAKAKAKGEFETVLKSTGKRLEDIKDYVADHPQLKRPFYHVPHQEGVAGTAAQFVLHVNDLMNRRNRFWPVREAIPKRSAA